jgi:hypothetical protein
MSFDVFEDGEEGLSEIDKLALVEYHNQIHRVFKQNQEGVKLLDKWFDDYVMSPTVVPGNSLEAHGIREGTASFVRHIMKTIEMVENNYNQPTENSDD